MTRRVNRTQHTAFALLTLVAAPLAIGQAQQMPRMPDGRPDLSGYWVRAGAGVTAGTDAAGDVALTLPARDNDIANFEKDFSVMERSHPNKPLYKPEYWEQIQDLDWNGLTADPVFSCKPAGVPRIGPPHKIVQTPTEIVFLYDAVVNRGPAEYRVIPLDGRDHLPVQINDTSWLGYGVGHWEGDTLVIESVGFNNESWLGWSGYIHSWDMTVTERLRREGDELHWEATVTDDTMLLEPWTLDPIVSRLNPDPQAFFFGEVPCEERDAEHIVDPTVRG
jgi:hypothetical protein